MDKLPNYRIDFRSIRAEVSPEEWQARLELAACYRLIDAYGMTDLTYNHITLRVPGPQHHILINLYGMLYKEITASSLAKIDLDGNVIWKPDTDYYVNKAGYVIHGCIHRARPDVRAVIHTHTRAGMAVAAMQCGLLPISQTSIRFQGHIGYHDYEGPAVDLSEQEPPVRDLGSPNAMIPRSPRPPHPPPMEQPRRADAAAPTRSRTKEPARPAVLAVVAEGLAQAEKLVDIEAHPDGRTVRLHPLDTIELFALASNERLVAGLASREILA